MALLAALRLSGPAPAEESPRERGRSLYAVNCARCHGEDGSDTRTYPGARSLVEITQRLLPGEVIEKSRGFATVALEGADAAAMLAHLETFRAGRWPRPELLVETEWLARRLEQAGLRILDARSAAAYDAGHVPGAVRFDTGALRDAATGDALPRPEALASLFGAAGIGSGTHVVIYDDVGGMRAARLWLALSALGHRRAALVNGGWLKWAAEKRPVSSEAPRVAPAAFTPARDARLLCAAPEVLARKPGTLVLDTRTPEEFRAGRIPGAVHLEWKECVTGPHMLFKSADELRRLFAARGITPRTEVVTYCAVGARASHTLFALALLGYDRSRVYYGSFAEYSGLAGAPVEK